MIDGQVIPSDVAIRLYSDANQVACEVTESTDDALIRMWLHGRSRHTQRAYLCDWLRFQSFRQVSLHKATLADLQSFADTLILLAPASRSRIIAALKSLFAFAHRIGYLPFDVGRPLRVPATPNKLSSRILSEEEVHRMMKLEPNPRNRAILRLLYVGGLRVHEACALKWQDTAARQCGAGQITVFGKGGKTRVIFIPQATWQKIVNLRMDQPEDAPVFSSEKGAQLCECQVGRIVNSAARRAGIEKRVSPHWLRHAHASHSLDRGAPIHLVQETLGHSSVATTSRYLHARPQDSSARYLEE